MSAAGSRPVLRGDLQHWALVQADCLKLLSSLPDHCVDAVITDPPYGLGFNAQSWDGEGLLEPQGFQLFCGDWAHEAKRVLRPGGHLVAFGSTRTFHRLVVGCEEAGLEIRDQLLWLHGRGVPKSRRLPGGIGSGLKPAYEPIVLARAPLAARTIQANLNRFGTGGLNIDDCRLPRTGCDGEDKPDYWPTHLILGHEDECDHDCQTGCAVADLDLLDPTADPVSRLYYAAKSSRAEREAGLELLPKKHQAIFSDAAHPIRARANIHPTVKPIELMRWLVRLACPRGGLVLDPFAGSGSTGCAAVLEGRAFIGVEKEPEYNEIAAARLTHWIAEALRNRQQSVHKVNARAHTELQKAGEPFEPGAGPGTRERTEGRTRESQDE